MDYKQASTEELDGAKKTTTTIVAVIGVLFILYTVYVLFSLATGNWDSNKMLSVVILMGLVVIMIPMISRIGAIKKELESRN